MIKIDIQRALKGPQGPMILDLEIEINNKEIIALYGDSGVGKTCALRMFAGLMNPDKGKISVDGVTWFAHSKKINLSPQKRHVGYVFQDYSLFPNMTVQENLTYALNSGSDHNEVDNIIKMMKLGELCHRKPQTLSGGQQQRVALARALIQKPKILLLDEPFAALDANTRLNLQDYLLEVHKSFGLTTILVSHDISEVVKLSDKVLKMEEGKITKYGSPEEIFMDQKVSGKFKFVGEVLKIEKKDIIYVITSLVHNDIVQVVANRTEVENLKVGDKLMLVTKAFNPLIYKIS